MPRKPRYHVKSRRRMRARAERAIVRVRPILFFLFSPLRDDDSARG